jgi:hypothetical protein
MAARPRGDDHTPMTTLLFTSSHDRHWDAQIALRRPDLVLEESDRLERMTDRYWELTCSEYGPLGTTPTDRIRVLRHLINEANREPGVEHDPVASAQRELADQLGEDGEWTAAQAARLAALVEARANARPDILQMDDGTLLVGFGPRRRGGVFAIDRAGRASWTELAAATQQPLAA